MAPSLAVVGSGPAALYTLKYVLRRLPGLRVDVFEKSAEPFGLVRFGVAPDHPEVKNVAHEFTEMLRINSSNVRLLLGQEISSLSQLRSAYSAVLVATGAQSAARLPSQSQCTAREFVLWYNGHSEGKCPEISAHQAANVCVVGMGNVALDIARLLSTSAARLRPLASHGLAVDAIKWMGDRQEIADRKFVRIFARRGYEDAAFTNKEFRELLEIDGAIATVDPADLRMSWTELAAKVAEDRGKKRGLDILSRMIDNFHTSHKYANVIQLKFNTQSVVGSPCDLLVSSLGFRVQPLGDLPIDVSTGAFRHSKGRVLDMQGVYVTGWAKRGPRGNIASNIPDAAETAAAIVEDFETGGVASTPRSS